MWVKSSEKKINAAIPSNISVLFSFLLIYLITINKFKHKTHNTSPVPTTELMQQYLQQVRQETGLRVCERVFNTPDGKPSKWWLCFTKKKFMDKSLLAPSS